MRSDFTERLNIARDLRGGPLCLLARFMFGDQAVRNPTVSFRGIGEVLVRLLVIVTPVNIGYHVVALVIS